MPNDHKDRVIHIEDNEYITIETANGFRFSLGISNMDPEDQPPEIDMLFDSDLAVNCWGKGVRSAPPIDSKTQHVRIARQVIIPFDAPCTAAEPQP